MSDTQKQKPNGLIIRVVKDDGGSYVMLYDMIGERVVGNGSPINHEIYGTMPLDTIIFVKKGEDEEGLTVTDLQPITVDTHIKEIIDNNDFIAVVDEIYDELFEENTSEKEIKPKLDK